MNLSYVIVGFVVGACTAYSGVGAGAITTPLLIFLGISTSKAIGSDLLFALGTRLVAMIAHVQKRTVQVSVLWRLSLGGFPAAIIGVILSAQLHKMLDIHQLESILRFGSRRCPLSLRRRQSSSIGGSRAISPPKRRPSFQRCALPRLGSSSD